MATKIAPKQKSLGTRLKQQWMLQLMTIPGVIFILIFSYIPMGGIVIAFQNYKIARGFLGSEWVGFAHFQEMFTDPVFFQAATNTIVLSFWNMVIGFPAPIIFALLLNEVPFTRMKKFIQTSSYLPHFISFVVVMTMWYSLLDVRGPVNNILQNLGLIDKPISFWAEPTMFRALSVIVNIWKSLGWGAIVYLAAISGIDTEIYEAARIDGCGRMRLIRSITLPNLYGIISVMMILNVSSLVRGSLDVSKLLGNEFTREVSYMIEYYSLQMGLETRRYSFATAISLLQSVLSLILVLSTNWLSGKLTDRKIF